MQALVHYTTRAQFRRRMRDLVAQAQETPTRWQKPVAIVDEKTGKVLRMAHPNPDLLAGVLAPVGKWIRTTAVRLRRVGRQIAVEAKLVPPARGR